MFQKFKDFLNNGGDKMIFIGTVCFIAGAALATFSNL